MKREQHRVLKGLVLFGAASYAVAVCAGQVVVGDLAKVEQTEDTTIVLATKVQADGYPSDVASPVFWFDATQTNGWEFVDEGGRKQVTKIPSLVGSRYLAVDGGAGHWHGWNGGTVKNLAPSYIADVSSVLPGVAVDFGGLDSRYALCFDPDPETASGQYPNGKNVMRNIGSVVVVYDSSSSGQLGGGFFLGGGYTGDFEWHRGYDNTSSWMGNWMFSNPIMCDNANHAAYSGTVRHDGLPTWPMFTGFNHGWEVLTFQASSASCNTLGPGFGDTRDNMAYCSGGMKMGEMMIFDRVLTIEEAQKLECYLEKKWFGRGMRGWNGEAMLGDLRVEGPSVANSVTVDIPDGSSLEIGRLRGGRLGGKVIKTGEGDLKLGVTADFGGALHVSGGSLDMGLRAIPTEFPHDLYLRFDPSDEQSVVTVTGSDNKEVVAKIDDLAGGTVLGNRVCLRSRGDNRPWIIRDALGNGRNVVDCGRLMMNGAKLSVTTDFDLGADYTVATAKNTPTIIMVWGLQRGGGHIANGDAFGRGDDPYDYRKPMMAVDRHWNGDNNWQTNGLVFVDGVKVDPSKGFEDASYHVVAYGVSHGNLRHFGAADEDGDYCGGTRYGEVLVWNRVLTEQEIRDASAMLAWKWLGRVNPGYARPTPTKTAQVQHLVVDGATTVRVADGDTVRVGRLSVGAPLVKKGTGNLAVERLDSWGPVSVDEGTVSLVNPPEPADVDKPAFDPQVHFDVCASETLMLSDHNEGQRVKVWNDLTRKNVAYAFGEEVYNDMFWPDYLPNALNGHPVLDFRKGGNPGGVASASMYFGYDLDSIRSVYMIVGTHNDRNGYFLLGSCSQGGSPITTTIEFHSSLDGSKLFEPYPETKHVWGGEIRVNGAEWGYDKPLPDNEYQLLEIHTTAGAHAGGIACERPQLTNRMGGPRIGELIVYNRVLTEREKVATRNYLMKKWFNAKPEALPEVAVNDSLRLKGNGVIVKESSGVTEVTDMSGWGGTLTVARGTLKLSGSEPSVVPALVTDGLVYHADATRGLTLETNAVGRVSVLEWKSALNDGWTAVPGSVEYKPIYHTGADGLGGLPVVSITDWTSCLRFKKDGEFARLSGVKTIVWMIGSRFGGGFMMGGGGGTGVDDATCGWHRGIAYPIPERPQEAWVGTTNICAIAYDAMQDGAWTADWWKNGEPIDPSTTGLSGSWDQVTMVTAGNAPDGAEKSVEADGFAFDGRSMKKEGATNAEYNGHQELAEVLCYNRRLTDEERQQVEAYLRCKWNLGMHAKAVGAEIVLAADAALDLGGGVQTVGRISGTGTISNGAIAVDELVADGALTVWPTAEKCFIRPGQKVTIVNPPADAGDGAVVRIMKVGAFEGSENLRSAVFTGTWPDTVKPRLCLKDGYLVLWYRPQGLIITVR